MDLDLFLKTQSSWLYPFHLMEEHQVGDNNPSVLPLLPPHLCNTSDQHLIFQGQRLFKGVGHFAIPTIQSHHDSKQDGQSCPFSHQLLEFHPKQHVQVQHPHLRYKYRTTMDVTFWAAYYDMYPVLLLELEMIESISNKKKKANKRNHQATVENNAATNALRGLQNVNENVLNDAEANAKTPQETEANPPAIKSSKKRILYGIDPQSITRIHVPNSSPETDQGRTPPTAFMHIRSGAGLCLLFCHSPQIKTTQDGTLTYENRVKDLQDVVRNMVLWVRRGPLLPPSAPVRRVQIGKMQFQLAKDGENKSAKTLLSKDDSISKNQLNVECVLSALESQIVSSHRDATANSAEAKQCIHLQGHIPNLNGAFCAQAPEPQRWDFSLYEDHQVPLLRENYMKKHEDSFLRKLSLELTS